MSKNCLFFSCHGGQKDFFEKGLHVAVRSARLTNPHLPVFILHDGLSGSEKNTLEGCHLIEVDGAVFETGIRNDLTRAAYFKLYAEKLEGYDMALYLDSDLVVLDNLDDIFNNEGPLAARREQFGLSHDFTNADQVAKDEKIPNEGAFMNSGVVCFDLRYWREKKLLEQALGVAKKYGWDCFKNADQGILNILAHRTGGFVELPVIYNYLRWPDMMCNVVWKARKNKQGYIAPVVLRRFQQKIASFGVSDSVFGAPMAKIVHWNGPVKPWQFGREEDRDKLYGACYEQFVSGV